MDPLIRKGFEEYLKSEKKGGLRETSVKAYLRHIEYLYEAAGDDVLKTRTKYSEVAALIRQISMTRSGKKGNQQWSRNMTAKFADMITVFFTWAWREGLIENNPMQFRHEFKKGKSPAPRYFKTQAQIDTVLNHPQLLKVYDVMIRFLLDSGLRRIEACNLNIEDLDLENCSGILLEAKNGQYRTFYCKPETAVKIRKYLQSRRDAGGGRPKDPLFVNREGGRFTPGAITKYFNRLGHKIGMDLNPHMCRHTVGRNMRRNGARLEDIADVLGHNSLSSTRIYAGLEDEEVKQLNLKFNVMPA